MSSHTGASVGATGSVGFILSVGSSGSTESVGSTGSVGSTESVGSSTSSGVGLVVGADGTSESPQKLQEFLHFCIISSALLIHSPSSFKAAHCVLTHADPYPASNSWHAVFSSSQVTVGDTATVLDVVGRVVPVGVRVGAFVGERVPLSDGRGV